MSKNAHILAIKCGETGNPGFHPLPIDEAVARFEQFGLWVGPRPVLENDPNFRQVLPYVLIKRGDEYLRYSRTKKGNEARLYDLQSIGVGGHIDLPDIAHEGGKIDLYETIWENAAREVMEEVSLHTLDFKSRGWVGIVVDNIGVGAVHIGVVGVWELKDSLDINHNLVESHLSNVDFVTVEELVAGIDRLEPWSAMIVRAIEKGVV